MGKKSKKNKSSENNNNIINNTSKSNITVSLITISQLKRFECLKILFEIIQNQTYKNIIEWIIVEGSKTTVDANLNEQNVEKFIEEKKNLLNFPIIYIKREKEVKLGELRNIGNARCSGDITVCMDDDDYYFPDRVEHVVKKLSGSSCLIAGCSNHLMYDYNLDKLIQMKTFGPNHSINSCMAWKKEYLEKNSHDPSKEFGEEQSFTKNYTEPMVSLDPFSTVILSSHITNTFGKKLFFIAIQNDIPSGAEKIIDNPISKYIPTNILNQYKNIFIENLNKYVEWDIVYMCGAFSMKWEPSDGKLGGSEQAVVNLSENWVKSGKKVIVYGEVPDKTFNGVVYKPWQEFNFNAKYKNLILWRSFGLITILPFNIQADKIIFDMHDNFIGQNLDVSKKFCNKVDKVLLKSNYHKSIFLERVDPKYDQNKIIVIPNGIRVEKFSIQPQGTQRNPFRFCYCSCYTRGLDKIIGIVWPIIYGYEPRAELHVYYGMDGIRDENQKNYLKSFLVQPGVMDHGRQPIEMIIREKYLSTFHFYITNTEGEIDCISIRESLVTGCIPLLSNFGVFKEREGIHFDFNDEKQMKMAAINIINLLKNSNKIEEYRKKIVNHNTIINWNTISLEWDKFFVK